jgi:hypothetical protein
MRRVQQVVCLLLDDGARNLQYRSLRSLDPRVADDCERGGGGSLRQSGGNASGLTTVTNRSSNSQEMKTKEASTAARSRCTAISSAASERELARYTTATPGEFQRPP